jgi:uncharacterized repeat protein (TIGR03803 family)
MRTSHSSGPNQSFMNSEGDSCPCAGRARASLRVAFLFFVLGAAFAASGAAHLQTIKVFGVSDLSGALPASPLIQGRDGALYGTASSLQSGSYMGAVYRIGTNGTYTPLHIFNFFAGDGVYPYVGLVQGGDGTLYGATSEQYQDGLYGTIYRLNPDGSGFTTLHKFSTNGWEGIKPFGELIFGGDGALYGTTSLGGSNSVGTVFKIRTDGSGFGVLYYFRTNVVDAQGPQGALLRGSDGYLYGSTSGGGASNAGAIYKLGQDGRGYELLHSFGNNGTDGTHPYSGLMEGDDGALYGTTSAGGTDNYYGTIFKINRDGTGYNVLHNFTVANADGQTPSGTLFHGPDGALYGTTRFGGSGIAYSGQGIVFRINEDGSGYQMLHNFNLKAGDGLWCFGGLMQANDGALYGTTYGGGSYRAGTVFKVGSDGSGYNVLWSFYSAGGDGSNALALVEGTNGVLYGASSGGGTAAGGVIFSLNKDGSAYKVLCNLPFKSYYAMYSPATTLICGRDGILYGLSGAPDSNSVAGTVFRLNPDGSDYRALQRLSTNGISSGQFAGVLLHGADGALYGTTERGGSNSVGMVFRVATDGSGYAELHDFGATASDGQRAAALMEADDGALYGTTVAGGEQGSGTVFAMAKNGSGYRIVHSFTTNLFDANGPGRQLIQGSDGALYGATQFDGYSNRGAIFTLHKDGSQYSVLCSIQANFQNHFCGEVGLCEGADGALYGALGSWSDDGLIFRVNRDGSGYEELYNASGRSTAGYVNGYWICSLIKGRDGAFYGTTGSGALGAIGTVFRLWPPQTPDMLSAQSFLTPSRVSFAGQAGSRYQVLRSEDLTNWSVLNTITMPAGGLYTNVDEAPPAGAAYYRAAWVP